MKNRLPSLCSLLLLLNSACVSVNLKGNGPTKSSDYSFADPARPFFKMKSDQADHAWQSEKTGNTLAVLSECNEGRDPSLALLENETVQALNGSQLTQTVEWTYQGRAARRSSVTGTLDGIAVQMDIVTFKKNSCSYTLTYLGPAQGFEKEKEAFESFIKGFNVP